MRNILTQDLTEFGSREFSLAAQMFQYLAEENPLVLEEHYAQNVRLWFNRESGEVFLASEDASSEYLLVEGKVVRFEICMECGEARDFRTFVNNEWCGCKEEL